MIHVYAVTIILLLLLILGAVRAVARNQVMHLRALALFRLEDERRP